MLTLPKFSMGIGDRFAHQGQAQLAAFVKAKQLGVEVAPVWNKSNREHLVVHSAPPTVRAEADAAVQALKWEGAYFVDADHIGLKTVDPFVETSDFFTLDVAAKIGEAASEAEILEFVESQRRFIGTLKIPDVGAPLNVTPADVDRIARKYLAAAQEAGRIYQHIETAKGAGRFVTEVSMDETDQPQTPVELLFILAMLADERIPLQTIAPKFTGRFNKGVDYVGDLPQFEREFNDDLAVIAFSIAEFGLPTNLKLSVHSGSDKFSIYQPIRRALRKQGAGLHVKTAGTTWLEELIGLARAGGAGLEIAQQVYASALDRFDELCAPYTSVIDIDRKKLPAVDVVRRWTGEQYAAALRHDPKCRGFNADLRQLLHVGYKVAAEMGDRYLQALRNSAAIIAEGVTENTFDRHLRRIFIDD